MGKIKNFFTGMFSKKKTGDDEEIMQIQPVDEPDRNFIEHESRYDTPDYQAFLHDMGYINADETRGNKAEEANADNDGETDNNTDAASENPEAPFVCEVDQDFIDEGVAELGVNDVWPEEED